MISLSNGDLCALLGAIWGAGAKLELSGADQLVARNGVLLSPEIVQAIRTHKAQIVGVLSRSAGLVCPHCGAAHFAVPTFDGFENFECFSCGRCSGCRKGKLK